MSERGPNWIQTHTGRRFWPLDPRPEDVHHRDISHALSNLCRFGGHTRKFYSVAEHSVLLAEELPVEHRLWALLHDASEAYMVDLPRPLKRTMPAYATAEKNLLAVIAERFSLPRDIPEAVLAADAAILTDEMQQAFAPPLPPDLLAPLGVTLQFWTPEEAEQRYLLHLADAWAWHLRHA